MLRNEAQFRQPNDTLDRPAELPYSPEMAAPEPLLTELLARAQHGDREAWEHALPLVYEELRRIAAAHFRNEPDGHLLQPTALVHEVWLKLLRTPEVQFESRIHFFSLCSRLMRQILVDQGRRRRLEGQPLPGTNEPVEFGALDEALSDLAKLSPRQSQVAEMRFFAGMSVEEIATSLECSPRTVKRDWLAARVWLFQHLQGRPR